MIQLALWIASALFLFWIAKSVLIMVINELDYWKEVREQRKREHSI